MGKHSERNGRKRNGEKLWIVLEKCKLGHVVKLSGNRFELKVLVSVTQNSAGELTVTKCYKGQNCEEIWRGEDITGRSITFWCGGQEATSNPSNPNWWLLEATRPHQVGYYVCKLFLTCFPVQIDTGMTASLFPHAPAEIKSVPHLSRVNVAPGRVPAAPPQMWSIRIWDVAGESCCPCSRKADACPHNWQAFLLLTAPRSQLLLTVERGMLLPA